MTRGSNLIVDFPDQISCFSVQSVNMDVRVLCDCLFTLAYHIAKYMF